MLAVSAGMFVTSLTATAPSARAGSLLWSDPIPLNTSGGTALNSVACPTASQCTAVDPLGREITFDPSTGVSLTRAHVAPSASVVACPSASLCVAIGGGAETTFNPTSPGSAAVTTLISSGELDWLSCPSTQQCTALYSDQSVSATGEVTFNPAAPGRPITAKFPGYPGLLEGVACPTMSMCVAITISGGELTFNPTAPGVPTPVAIDSGAILLALACVSVNQCTAVGDGGIEVTFDPVTPGPRAAAGVDSDYADTLLAVACASQTQCSAIDEAGFEVTFDPVAPTNPTSVQVLQTTTTASELTAIACSSPNECTAVNGLGQAMTFDPTAPSTPSPSTIDPGQPLLSVACAAATQCTAAGDGGEVTLDPTAPSAAPMHDVGLGATLDNVTCPSSNQCTATGGPAVLTFNPTAPSPMPLTTVGTAFGFTGLACPSVTQCTGVSAFGGEVTFNPSAPALATEAILDSGASMQSVACPTTRECAASDIPSGNQATDGVSAHGEMTFDPVTVGTTTQAVTAPLANLQAIACPSANQCTAVDSSGRAFTFDPGHPTAATSTVIDPGHLLIAVACPTTWQCVALDNSGQAIAGSPNRPGSWETEPIAGAAAPSAVACTGEHCVVVDRAGNATIGTFGPWEMTLPTIRGRAAIGHVLTVSAGEWSGPGPMQFAERWQRCKRACVDIRHATGTRYVLGAADLGARVQVIVTALDTVGSAQAISPAIGPVALSTAQLKAALASALTLHGKAARIRRLLITHRCRLRFDAPTAGKLIIGWYDIPLRAHRARTEPKPVRIAGGSAYFARARRLKVTMKLTADGVRLLKRSKRLRLTAKGTFTAAGLSSVSATRRITLK